MNDQVSLPSLKSSYVFLLLLPRLIGLSNLLHSLIHIDLQNLVQAFSLHKVEEGLKKPSVRHPNKRKIRREDRKREVDENQPRIGA